MYVTTSFVSQHFICMSLLHLHVTTSIVCQNLMCMSLLASVPHPPSFHTINSCLTFNTPEISLHPLFPEGQRSNVHLLRGRREGLGPRLVVTYKWSVDIQMRFWHTNEVLTYKWISDIQIKFLTHKMGNWPLECTVKCAFDIQKETGTLGTFHPHRFIHPRSVYSPPPLNWTTDHSI